MRRNWKPAALALVIVIAGFLQAFSWASDRYINRAQDSGHATLGLVVEAIDQAIGRFEPIPALISRDPAFQQLLRDYSPQGTGSFMNEKLRQIALSIGASEVYVINTSGTTIATSNYRDDDSFLGMNFSFRPYFVEAVAGETSFFHALGTTSGERGFFFSAPILDEFEVAGVLVVKILAGSIERDWRDLGLDVLIADENGIVFLTSREEYKYRALAPISEPVRQQISETLQFPMDQVVPLDLSTDIISPQIVQISLNVGLGVEQYLAESQPLTISGWHAIVFTPLEPVRRQVGWALVLVGSAFAAIVLAVLVVWQRRAHILQRIKLEQEQREILEYKVRERTADLNAANTNLKLEVAERRNAEDRLRKSQKELIQAGKLAALGQMSAAISHEINQPLGAIKSYAANAAEFLSRSRVEDAKSNIEIISKMTDRITDISHHLRNFARQPGDKLRTIDVDEVIRETIGVVGPQLRACSAEVVFEPLDEPHLALGGKLRLQQVLVNIVSNALEAMNEDKAPRIEISLETRETQIDIHVRDYGPGVAMENIEYVFDAFYTTKSAGSGMGLGMSISQNIISDFGGSIKVSNHPERGAVFTVTLKRVKPETVEEAAE